MKDKSKGIKCADREHTCDGTGDGNPRCKIMHDIGRNEWDVWIPDFLDHKNTRVQAFVWGILYCPFCSADLSNKTTSQEL